ncbi:relaxase domain-containing protein [Sphaerisporangium sp. TRM90804]|uniref:relaxase domain-containing protein n=1 Tax=Sphaerisporangium sp. TRM90804 TaxID=3031113 RepID=UPI002447A265|nr:relaxase domain-containing protein [Sphaerisporangium sp. TRM90804]MDH2429009.1 relaxase domain-containing protein [Sphaerisporangium sp. TRM90804]
MLTIRTLSVPVGDPKPALSAAEHALEYALSPQAFTRKTDPGPERANSMWLGSNEALRSLGVERGAETRAKQLTSALLGRHTVTGAQARPPHFTQPSGAGTRPSLGGPGRFERQMAVTSFVLDFWAPGSMSWVWAQSDAKLRASLGQAMVQAAGQAIEYLTRTRPLVAGIEPARGFAASIALHVISRKPPWLEPPPPQLHVHCYLVGVLDANMKLRTPHSEALYGESVMRECGAAGRAVLAEELRKLRFPIEALTGPGRRFFEIAGVPPELAASSSAWEHAECQESTRTHPAEHHRHSHN